MFHGQTDWLTDSQQKSNPQVSLHIQMTQQQKKVIQGLHCTQLTWHFKSIHRQTTVKVNTNSSTLNLSCWTLTKKVRTNSSLTGYTINSIWPIFPIFITCISTFISVKPCSFAFYEWITNVKCMKLLSLLYFR